MTPFRTERRVDWGDCDAAGIVFYPNYFRWMDSAFHELAESIGCGQRRLQNDFGLLGTPLIDTGCSFKAPASFGDPLEIAVLVTRLGESGFTLSYRFLRDGAQVAEGHEARVCVRAVSSAIARATIPDALRVGLEKLYAA